jgi:hypothetical protein
MILHQLVSLCITGCHNRIITMYDMIVVYFYALV